MEFILKNQWRRLAIVCAVLLFLNVIVIAFFDIHISRWVRWISTFILTAFLFHHRGYRDLWIFSILILFLIRDGFILQYEWAIHKTSAFILTNIAYVLLLLINARKTKFILYNPVLVVFTMAMIGLNAFNLYYLSDVIWAGLDNNLQFILFFLQGVFLIVLGLMAFIYNDRFEGKSPLLFLIFTFCLILCDLSGLAAYFYQWEVAYFPERIFYVLSLTLLVNYSLNRSTEEQESLLYSKS